MTNTLTNTYVVIFRRLQFVAEVIILDIRISSSLILFHHPLCLVITCEKHGVLGKLISAITILYATSLWVALKMSVESPEIT